MLSSLAFFSSSILPVFIHFFARCPSSVQIKENLYTKERIEDVYPKRNLDEVDKAIKDLLEKNSNLQEEVRKLKREQKIQTIRLCEVMEEIYKAKEEIEEKNNEIQHLSL